MPDRSDISDAGRGCNGQVSITRLPSTGLSSKGLHSAAASARLSTSAELPATAGIPSTTEVPQATTTTTAAAQYIKLLRFLYGWALLLLCSGKFLLFPGDVVTFSSAAAAPQITVSKTEQLPCGSKVCRLKGICFDSRCSAA
ncbi:hypothetical protein ABBQ32_007551 [Trebouxia sp. C0010 RCD-2024]